MKLAKKSPEAIKTVVSIKKDVAECWYAKPQNLGKIEYRGGYWWTQDGHRCISSRDALEHLVRLSELIGTRQGQGQGQGHSSWMTEKQPASPPLPSVRAPRRKIVTSKVQDPFVQDLIKYLREHPEVKQMLAEGKARPTGKES